MSHRATAAFAMPRLARTMLSKIVSPMAMGSALWFSASGCSTERPDGQMTADLERDLALAMYARPAAVVSAVEGGQLGAPSGRAAGRRDAVPQPRRTPRPAPSSHVEETVSEETILDTPLPAISMTPTETSTQAAAPEPTIPAPSVESPVAVIPVGGPSDGGGHEGEGHGRRGGGFGGVIGAIIRGGAAGVDNCEEHDRRRGRSGSRGPILTTGGGWGRGVGTVIQIGGTMVANGGNGGGIRPTFPRR